MSHLPPARRRAVTALLVIEVVLVAVNAYLELRNLRAQWGARRDGQFPRS